MGGKKSTVGYWYHLLLHFKLTQGPIDAFLAWRGGDRNAWEGELTSSGEIMINARNLWGGEEKEGGIEGPADILFGDEDQEPNAYLLSNLGEKLSAERGIVSAVFKGGRYGAFSPYPKDSAFKFRRILKGWEGDVCWYPEKASIGYAGEDGGYRVMAISSNGKSLPGDSAWESGVISSFSQEYGIAGPDRYFRWNHFAMEYSTDAVNWVASIGSMGGGGGSHTGVFFKGQLVICGAAEGVYRSSDGGATLVHDAYPSAPRITDIATNATTLVAASVFTSELKIANEPEGPWGTGAAHGLSPGQGISIKFGHQKFMVAGSRYNGSSYEPAIVSSPDGIASVTNEALPIIPGAEQISGLQFGNDRFVAVTNNNRVITKRMTDSSWTLQAENPVDTGSLGNARNIHYLLERFYWTFFGFTLESVDGESWVISSLGANAGVIVAGPLIDTRTHASVAMNPAHILYDSHTFRHMDGYPVATISDASLRAAADTLYAEGFGLCAEYDPNTTSVEEFQQRICDTIGGNFSLDDSTGEYHLDLLRPNFDIDSLPILTDDDILEFSEEPTILDDAVNSIVVEYFDPETKETRITEPVESLGTIQAFGVNTSTARYPDIPVAALAARVGQRDVNASTTPTRKFDLKLNRVPYALRKGTRVRLQLLKRGIADMVCVIVEVDKGTLKSGAISMKLVQDIYSMPSTSFVVGEPGEDTSPTTVPVPIVLQAALEVPYVELAGRMTTADLTALAPEAGFIAVVAADPARTRNYSLYTQPAGGEYVDRGVGDWCPTAVVVEASAFDDTEFTLSSGAGLANVDVGTAALWGSEIVRVDARDVGAGTVQFGRACGDTVPVKHEAGERVWFYDADAYADDTEYVVGETVSAKLLNNTVSQRLDIALATVLTVVMDERQARPYPPARFRVNGEVAPAYLFGELTISWAHRDRILQADQLLDTELASVGPEAGTTYTVRTYVDDVLEDTQTGITADFTVVTPSSSGLVRIEAESERAGLTSWQMQVRSFPYTTTESFPLELQSGDVLQEQGGDTIYLMG